MRAVDIIIRKRDRGELTREEIRFFVNGIATGRIPDYQAAAWAMAVLLNGMTPRETTDLTLAMRRDGKRILYDEEAIARWRQHDWPRIKKSPPEPENHRCSR